MLKISITPIVSITKLQPANFTITELHPYTHSFNHRLTISNTTKRLIFLKRIAQIFISQIAYVLKLTEAIRSNSQNTYIQSEVKLSEKEVNIQNTHMCYMTKYKQQYSQNRNDQAAKL